MIGRLKWKLKEWIIDLICVHVVIGGNCGLCGAVVSDQLLPRHWPWTVCAKCADVEEDNE